MAGLREALQEQYGSTSGGLRDALVQQYGYPQHIQEALNEPFGWGDTVRAATQGATLNWGDEWEAGLLAFEDYFTGRSESPLGTYDYWKQALDERMKAYSDDRPWTSGGLELAGAIPTAFALPYASWVKGAPLSTNLGKLALEGAAYGGIAGAGASSDQLVQDPWSVATDAAIGAGTGSVLAPAVGGAGRWIGNQFIPNQQAIELNKMVGRTAPLSERYEALGKVQDALDYTSGGAFSASQRSSQYSEEAIEGLKNLAPNEFKAARDVGRDLIFYKNTWENIRKNEFDRAFRQVTEDVDMSGVTIPINTLSFLSSERASFGGADKIADIVEIPSIKRLRKALEGGQEITVDGLWKLRTELGESISTGKFGVDDISQAKAKQLYANVSDDLNDAIARYSDYNTAQDFINLNEDYSRWLDALDSIRPVFAKSNREQHSPEKVVAELVKRFRDEPTSLATLRAFREALDDDILDEVGLGALYQTALNRGQVDPTKALERYNLSRSKTGILDPASYADDGYSLFADRVSTSPALNLTGGSRQPAYQYEQAMYLAQRAQDAIERGRAADPSQLATSALPAGLAGMLGADIGGMAGTALVANAGAYLLRRGLSSQRVARFTEWATEALQLGRISAEDLAIITAMLAGSDNEPVPSAISNNLFQ